MKTAILLTLITLFVGVQSELRLDTSKSTLTISGTSTIHDWEEEVEEFSIKGNYADDAITNLEARIVTKSIKSGKSMMDSKTYEALKANKYPVIAFKANKMTISGNQVNGTGTLTLAGKTRQIPLTAKVIKTDDKLQVIGKVELTMSDYGIDPPTAMFGSVSTGDDVTINYNIFLYK